MVHTFRCCCCCRWCLQLRNFWQQLLADKSYFSACGMCRIDRQLLTSVCVSRSYDISFGETVRNGNHRGKCTQRTDNRNHVCASMCTMCGTMEWRTCVFPLIRLFGRFPCNLLHFSILDERILCNFIVLSLPLFPDQWSYRNVSRNFITVSEIRGRLRTASTGIIRCRRRRCSHADAVVGFVPPTPYSACRHTLSLTSDITHYWLLSKFISSTQWRCDAHTHKHTLRRRCVKMRCVQYAPLCTSNLHSISSSQQQPLHQDRTYSHRADDAR